MKLDEQESEIPNSNLTSPKSIIELPTKAHVGSLSNIKRIKHDLTTLNNDQYNKYENIMLTNLDTITVQKNPPKDNQLSNTK